MAQRFRVTRGYIEEDMLEGYDFEFCGLLDRDADGMGLWKCGRAGQILLATS